MDLTTTIIVRQLSGRFGTGIAIGLAAVVVALQTIDAGWAAGLLALVASALLVGLVWLWWGAAELRLAADGVTIDNPFRWRFLPWSQVRGASGAWGLNVLSESGKHPVWACPARGGLSMSSGKHGDPLPRLASREDELFVSLDAQRAARLVEECRIEVADDPVASRLQAEARSGVHWARIGILVALVVTLLIALQLVQT